jgi:thioredoxin reductase (NADPH)
MKTNGTSGLELASRACYQAQKFGAEMLTTKGTRLICNSKSCVIEVEDYTIMIAT